MKAKILRLLLFLLAAVCALSMAALADGDAVWRSGDGKTYATISEAIQNNPLYGTITLLKSTSGAAITVPANDRMTIDFGGCTYTVAAQDSMLAVQIGSGSVATLKNGKLVGTDTLSCLILCKGMLTVDGMMLTAGDAETVIYAQSGSVTIGGSSRIVSGSCIVQSASGIPVFVRDGVFSGTFTGGELHITGGQFYPSEGLPIADGYTLDENGCVVPVTACAGHSFGAWESLDENTHARACTQCGFQETAPHSYGAPVFDWYGDGNGNISASCRCRCRDCGHVFFCPDVTVNPPKDGENLYEATYSDQSGVVKTYRSYLTIQDSYSVTLNDEGDSYQYGAVVTLSAPDAARYYDFYEGGVLVAERATEIKVTVTRDRHFTAEPHTDRDTAPDSPVHVSTPLKSGNSWDVTLMWAIPDGIYDTGDSEPGAEAPRLVEAGIYYLYAAEKPNAPEAESVIQNGKQVIAPVGNGEALNGSFTLTAEVSEGNAKTMYALGYVIYETDGTSYTAYSAVAVGSAADTE